MFPFRPFTNQSVKHTHDTRDPDPQQTKTHRRDIPSHGSSSLTSFASLAPPTPPLPNHQESGMMINHNFTFSFFVTCVFVVSTNIPLPLLWVCVLAYVLFYTCQPVLLNPRAKNRSTRQLGFRSDCDDCDLARTSRITQQTTSTTMQIVIIKLHTHTTQLYYSIDMQP
ncbi:hypothetical protein QBC38DRAFT_63542 [Podospora fimiseda]|uniref:Transmembrane protein n=1 Tax=Podospora fimiseda TaxID=252190 RepID=A0AAN7BUZ0_9PEZI|nr:hypothetical protein QBC38DRAFT_63542 [Podospora fimiseda]